MSLTSICNAAFHTKETWDALEGQRRKERGMKAAAEANESPLEAAREFARRFALDHGEVTADDVGSFLEANKIKTGPWMGSLFKCPGWVFTGKWIPSKRPSNHGRMLRVWRIDKS